MPRREYTTSQSYIDWLKNIGCLVYLPLSADGDLQDKISGLSLQLTGNGSLVWTVSQQRYKMTTPSSYKQYVAVLNNGLSSTSFPNNKLTVSYRIKKISSSSSKYIRGLSPNSSNTNTLDSLNPAYSGTARSNYFPVSETSVATVYNANVDRNYYQDGQLYGTYSAYAPYLPSNWVLNGTNILLGSTKASDSTAFGVELYISEIYLFNTALDLATIRKIQGYE